MSLKKLIMEGKQNITLSEEDHAKLFPTFGNKEDQLDTFEKYLENEKQKRKKKRPF